MAEGPIGALLVRIGGDATGLLDAFQKGGKAAGQFSGTIKSTMEGLKGLAVALEVRAMAQFISHIADGGEAMAKMSEKTGIAVEQLSELKYASYLADISVEQLGTGLTKLAKSMQAAASGSKESAEVFKALGIEVNDKLGNLRSTDKVLLDLADKFSRMENGAGKTAIALKLFGRSGADLIPLLNLGSKGLQENAEEARKLGIVMSTEAAQAAQEFNDNMKRLKETGEGLARHLTEDLIKALSKSAEAFLNAKKQGDSFAQSLGTAISVMLAGDDLHRWNKEFVAATEQLGLAEKQLAAVKASANSPQGQRWAEEAARTVKKYEEQLIKAQAEVKRLQDIKPVMFPEKPPEGPKEKAPNMPDEQAVKDAAKRQQELVQAMITAGNNRDAIEKALNPFHLSEKEMEEQAHKFIEYYIKLKEDINSKIAAQTMNPTMEDDAMSEDPMRDLKLKKLRDSFKSEDDLELERHAQKMAQLQEFSDAELELIGGRKKAEQDLENEHWDNIRAIRNRSLANLADFSKANWKDQSKHMIGSLMEMTAGAAQQNRKMFEVNKIAATANAVVKGIEAVQSAYAFGSEWGGPVGGAAMAAIAAVATIANVQQIQSTQFGGGGSGSVPSLAGSPGAPVTETDGGGRGPRGPDTYINLHGQFFDEKMVRGLITSINETNANGGRINVL